MLVCFIVIWNILLSFGIHILWSFGNVVVFWYIFHRLGILCQEKSGNPGDTHLWALSIDLHFSFLVPTPISKMVARWMFCMNVGLTSGWPDWSFLPFDNFLGDCLLGDVYLKLATLLKFSGFLKSKKLCIHLDKNALGHVLGDFVHGRIWSPWLPSAWRY
jgi:hypothetical protein